MVQYVHNETDVGFNTFDVGFFQRTQRFVYSTVEGSVVSDDFNQQAIIIWCDYRACKCIAAIQTNAVTGTGTIYINYPCVRSKVVCRVFCSDTALDRKAVCFYIVLRFDVDFIGIQSVALCYQNLRLYDIDTGNHFGYGMFYLNTRVHFDEVMLTAGIYQEFYSTCTAIVYGTCNFQSIIADSLTLFFIQAQSRTKFDYFLVTTLNGAVTFE